jgi:hypothetical protein
LGNVELIDSQLKRSHYDMQPNYYMNTFEVYREVALQSLRIGKNADVFAYACHASHPDTDWSSWIPRWNMPSARDNVPLLPSAFLAGGDTALDWALGDTAEVLQIRGLRVGTITHVSACSNAWLEYTESSHLKSSCTSALLNAWQLISMERSNLDLADFAVYLLRCLQRRSGKNWIPLMTVACDRCMQSYARPM